MLKRSLGTFILCFLMLSVQALAAPCGKVTYVEGRVDVLHVEKNIAEPVSLGDPVEKGDIFRAKSRSKAEITLLNRNVLRIGPGARIEIKEATADAGNNKTIVGLFRGKIQAVSADELVKKVSALAEGRKFEVHTENAVCGIRDTNMLVGFERGATNVIFLSGKGYIFNPLHPGEIVSLVTGYLSGVTGGNAPPTPPRRASDEEIKSFVQQVSPSQSPAQSSGTNQGGGAPPGDLANGSETAGNNGSGAGNGAPTGDGDGFASPGSLPPVDAQGGDAGPLTQATFQFAGIGSGGPTNGAPLPPQSIPPSYSTPPSNQTTSSGPTTSPDSTGRATSTTPSSNVDSWTGGSGSWSSDSQWSNNKSPQTGNDVSILPSAGTVVYDAASSTSLGQVSIGSTGDGTTTLAMQQGQLTTQGLTVGVQGSGAVSQTGGVNAVSGNLVIGGNSGANGTYLMSREDLSIPLTLTVSGNESIGAGGVGTFNQTGGDHSVAGTLTIGGSGTYTMNGGTLSAANIVDDGSFALAGRTIAAQNETIGSNGAGVFIQTGGTNTVSGDLVIGGNSGSNGTYAMSQEDPTIPLTLTVSGNESIGAGGVGTFNQTGGDHSVAGTLTIGGSGTYTMNGGTLSAANIVNNGLFSYAGSDNEQVTGNFSQGSGGTLSLLEQAELNLTGTASVAGSLFVSAPSTDGGSAVIHAAGGLSGTFDSLQTPFDPTSPLCFTLSYGAQDLTMTAVRTRTEMLSASALSGPVLIDCFGFDLAGTLSDLSALFDAAASPATSLLTTFWKVGTVGGYLGSHTITQDMLSASNVSLQSMQLLNSAGNSNGWSVWSASAATAFSGAIPSAWAAELQIGDAAVWNRLSVFDLAGKTSGANISGTVIGYGADVTGTPATWVSIGEIMGTYAPGSLQMAAAGVAIETNKFLAMASDPTGQAMLSKIHVPCVEVGTATLAGSASSGGNALSVQIANAKYFALTAGGAPQLWASGAVSGTYSGSPTALGSVAISGGGLSASFAPVQWDKGGSGKWAAQVANGSGTLQTTSNGNPVYGNPIAFQGAAAGTVTRSAGTFTGTAAGAAAVK